MKDGEILDLCCEWIEDKDAHYLAKEGKIVFFSSDTGRKQDYRWHTMSLAEVVRIIQAYKMPHKKAHLLNQHHIVGASQETARVYEYAISSRHQSREGVFNYLEMAEMDLGDEVMAMLAQELVSQGFKALLLKPVENLFNSVQNKLDAGIGSREARVLLEKHFTAQGFELRIGSTRPLVDGKKVNAIMMPGSKPSEVISITDEVSRTTSKKIYGALK